MFILQNIGSTQGVYLGGGGGWRVKFPPGPYAVKLLERGSRELKEHQATHGILLVGSNASFPILRCGDGKPYIVVNGRTLLFEPMLNIPQLKKWLGLI